MESQKVFNRDESFAFVIVSGGEKHCTVRFPSDAEWIARAGRRKTMQYMLGRGKSRSEVLNPNGIDADLFAKVRTDQDGVPFDAVEASRVISRLERADVVEIVREGDQYRVRLKVAGGVMVDHLIHMLRQGDVDEYRDASIKITNERRAQEIRVNVEPAGKLYDKYIAETSGYAGSVPIIHKEVVVDEVITQLNLLEDALNESPEA